MLHFCCCNSVRFKEFATFLPAILSTLFGWPVTVRNFPTPCKIQGNCNPFFSPTFLTTKIQRNLQLFGSQFSACSSTCPCIERANPKLPKADSITKGKQHRTVEVGWVVFDDDKCALTPASPSSSSCI